MKEFIDETYYVNYTFYIHTDTFAEGEIPFLHKWELAMETLQILY